MKRYLAASSSAASVASVSSSSASVRAASGMTILRVGEGEEYCSCVHHVKAEVSRNMEFMCGRDQSELV